MDLLFLGGTQFVGRHMVEEAVQRGHGVTLFNRGNRADIFPELETIRGDRNGDLSALAGRRWDAVIDTSGYVPRQVAASAGRLKDAAEHYTFISSISVYADQTRPHQDESAALATLEDETVEEVTGETYGGLKVLCERAAEAAMPGRVLTLRPGLIVGPYDPTDRFTYWPLRVAAGGEVLAPGTPEAPVQFIDARDLAAFTLDALEAGTVGPYNVVSDPDQFSFGALLGACREASGSGARLTWVDEGFLLEEGVGPWMELPLWVPGEGANFLRTSNAKARGAGLGVRPLADTVAATLEWARTLPGDRTWRAGMERARERQLLSDWHAAASSG